MRFTPSPTIRPLSDPARSVRLVLVLLLLPATWTNSHVGWCDLSLSPMTKSNHLLDVYQSAAVFFPRKKKTSRICFSLFFSRVAATSDVSCQVLSIMFPLVVVERFLEISALLIVPWKSGHRANIVMSHTTRIFPLCFWVKSRW